MKLGLLSLWLMTGEAVLAAVGVAGSNAARHGDPPTQPTPSCLSFVPTRNVWPRCGDLELKQLACPHPSPSV